MTCLKESELQGYLEESRPSPFHRRVESHLASCVRCRARLDGLTATHQRVNAWLSELSSPADEFPANTSGAFIRLLNRVEARHFGADDHLARLLAPAAVEIAWYTSLYRN